MHKLLLILLMAGSCFAAQFPSDNILKTYIPQNYCRSFKDYVQKDNILKRLDQHQLVALIRKVPFNPLDTRGYMLDLVEEARKSKFVSHNIDCDELGAVAGILITREQINEAKERPIERNKDESSTDWILRITRTLEAKNQFNNHAWTGLKITGALAFTAISITLVSRWYKKRKTEKQNDKQSVVEVQQEASQK